MRFVSFCALMALAAAAGAAEWKTVPSPAEYRAMVDLDSVKPQRNFASFTLRRAYNEGHSDPAGNEFFSTRLIIIADCTADTAVTAATQYYGADRKLVHRDVQKTIRKSEFTAPEPGSDMAEAMKLACERFAAIGKGEAGTGKAGPAQSTTPKPPARSSSGTGIVVNRDGLVLTNNHVVRQCASYEVLDGNRRLKAALQAVDAANDLALLTVKEDFPAAALMRRDATPKLGEAVTVVGYPLVGVLGTSPSVGFGHVAATAGPRGNAAQMQISVPIQRGHSGGPVFDQAGNVIGVVVSKLDALKVAQRMGDLPQNINFAIRGDTVRAFLEAQNVDFTASDASAKLDNTEIASRGAAVTVRVRCIREGAAPAATPSTPTRSPDGTK
ncbi:MAG: trypsin-like peptidase domain-containing protein [Betaproteobacteria bacterium]|nr:trypsin-like peptidase domain-containing protein [Betaproteobacteria bacterium]